MASNKRMRNIIDTTVARWKETITSTAQPDVDAAEALLKKVNKNVRVFRANTPLEFYLAQAVVRGRMAKKSAKETAEKLGINPDFIKPLTRFGSPERLVNTHRWYRNASTNIMCKALKRVVQNVGFASSSGPVEMPERMTQVQLSNLRDLYSRIIPMPNGVVADREARAAYDHLNWRINFSNAQSHVDQSFMCLHEAVSGKVNDILNGHFVVEHHQYDAIHTEILCNAIGCKDADVIWHYEIFHHVPAFMQFSGGVLLLTGKPTIHKTAENQMHNDTGPAVEWADGKKLWYIDGHALVDCGEKIVLAPETLSNDDIRQIRNEEERRIAIDRMGWGRYLTAIDANVADARENWVDNTFEVLINPPKEKDKWQQEPLRMVLSCRSTGRKYFIAVPREVAPPGAPVGWSRVDSVESLPSKTIRNCADAQKWLADGATTPYLDYAKHPMNIVGAS